MKNYDDLFRKFIEISTTHMVERKNSPQGLVDVLKASSCVFITYFCQRSLQINRDVESFVFNINKLLNLYKQVAIKGYKEVKEGK